MTDDQFEDHEEELALAAEYALGLLSDEEAAAFEEILAIDPEFRAAYAIWAEDFAGLSDAISGEVPPKTVWAGVEEQLFPESKEGLLQRLGLVPAILGGLVAAMLVLVVTDRFGLMQGPGAPPQGPAALVAELAAEDQSLIVQARFNPASGLLDVTRQTGTARPDRVLELWLIAGGDAPVSLGVLNDEGTLSVAVPEALRPAFAGAVLAVSDEPPGGSPTGAPTGDVLAMGPITEA